MDFADKQYTLAVQVTALVLCRFGQFLNSVDHLLKTAWHILLI